LKCDKAPFGLDEWLAELSHLDAVVMGAVIHQLNQLTASDESSVQQLVAEISKDPGLTAKIIKVANSVLYNPARIPCNTISRAIMHVGFDTIRAICVSSLMIENLLKEHPREALIKQMARSFHAAVQARNLMAKARMEVKEQIFVATLMLHLGELLIWAYPHKVTDDAYQRFLRGAEALELEAILGVSFNRLTQEIASEWSLGETLNEVLMQPHEPGKMAQAVMLGDEIALAMEQGLESTAMQNVLAKAAEFTNQKQDVLAKTIMTSSDEATRLSKLYGDPKITLLIKEARAKYQESQPQAKPIEPDPQYQLQALQAIMQMMGKRIRPGQLFEQVLLGLHQGVGLERVALAIFNASRTQVSAKYIVGDRTAGWKDKFRFDYERHNANLFAVVMARKQPIWIGAQGTELMAGMRSQKFDGTVGLGDFLLGPVIANGRQVGFLYADMRVTGRPLNNLYFSGFKHFMQQISLCLEVLAKQK